MRPFTGLCKAIQGPIHVRPPPKRWNVNSRQACLVIATLVFKSYSLEADLWAPLCFKNFRQNCAASPGLYRVKTKHGAEV